MPRVTLLAALAENRVIGRDGGLPWRLPDDLKRFKRLTMGHPIVMGRRTWDEVGHPLPGRRSIVLSRDPDLQLDGAEVASTLEEALGLCRDADEVFVIGGGEIYSLALPRADRLELTIVHARPEGDTLFPEVDLGGWRLVAEEDHPVNERHEHPFTFRTYERRPPDPPGPPRRGGNHSPGRPEGAVGSASDRPSGAEDGSTEDPGTS